jgi:serine/threonine protein kinase
MVPLGRNLVRKEKPHYRIKQKFAKGSFGDIFLACDQEDNEYVLKRVAKTKSSSRVQNEAEALQRLNNSPGISRLHRYFEDKDNHYLVMDYVKGWDLFSFLEKRNFAPLKEEFVKNIIRQLLKAILTSHENGVVHRDLKLENILIDVKQTITLIDFGLCELYDKETMSPKPRSAGKETRQNLLSTDWSGSLEYVAPEVLAKIPYDPIKAEVYSFGVTFYALMFSQFPFANETRLAALQNNVEHPQPPISPKFKRSPEGIDLLLRMLKNSPIDRINMEEIQNHPWFTNGTITEISNGITSM